MKVHAPHGILLDYAEDLRMKMPTKREKIKIQEWYEGRVSNFIERLDPWACPTQTERDRYFFATFDKERLSEFHNNNNPDEFFTDAERGRLVYYILQKAKFREDPVVEIGVGNLISYGGLEDAYPLHDCSLQKQLDQDATSSQRQKLARTWASFGRFFKPQPIADVKEYFGEKIALYFAWLGFYTTFLVPAAIVGIVCFVYGVTSSLSSPKVSESCTDTRVVSKNGTTLSDYLFYMCPLCDKRCSYYLLSSGCLYAKVSHFFDNEATLVFAVFMSVWATLFLEFWKRRQVWLAHEWHSIGFEEAEEQVRCGFFVDRIYNILKQKRVRFIKFFLVSGLQNVSFHPLLR